MRSFALAPLLFATAAFSAQVTVDVGLQRRPISPLIYGVSQGSPAQAQRMGASVRRLGGNQFLRYNFANDTSNTAGDGYHYRNFVLAPDAGDTFAGQFIGATRSAGLVPFVQLPVMGFISKDSPAQAPFTCSFPVSVYGPQQSVDPLDPDCGNGVFTDGGAVTGNSPFDTSVASDAGYVRDVVAALVARFGQASDGGVSIYQLGNQPGLWHETHRDVHPGRATYDEVKGQLREYGLAVKQADPLAKTAGPAAWGWLEYFDSANFDRQNYNDLEFLPYYLQQAALLETASGKRVLDYLDIHAYPQGEVANPDGGVSLKVVSDDDSPTLNALRLRSTRVLWDPSYTSETWEICCYDSVQRIIPRVRTWIAQQYPGTGLSISSYGWGGLSHVNGALTQAEILGILGREGVDVATLDEVVPENGVAEDAFALFRNFDGAGSQFGATSVLATSDDLGAVSAFAAHDLSGRVTLVLINKDPNFSQTANVNFVGVGSMGPWRAYGFGAGGRLGFTGSGSVSGGAFSVQLPAYTAWIVEFLPSGEPTDGGMMGSGGGAGGGGGSSGGGAGGGSAGGGSAGGGSAGGGSAGGGSAGGGAAGGGSAGGGSAGGGSAGGGSAGGGSAGGGAAGGGSAGGGSAGGGSAGGGSAGGGSAGGGSAGGGSAGGGSAGGGSAGGGAAGGGAAGGGSAGGGSAGGGSAGGGSAGGGSAGGGAAGGGAAGGGSAGGGSAGGGAAGGGAAGGGGMSGGGCGCGSTEATTSLLAMALVAISRRRRVHAR